MKYSYYPGCSMSTTGIEYSKSLEYVNEKTGIEFIEIPDWNCCGATTGHSVSQELGAALPARNIALCEAQGLGLEIAVPCASCYSRMKHASKMARERNEWLSGLVEMPLEGNLEIVSLLEIYNRPEVAAAIEAAVSRPLGELKAACYYGCLYARPTGTVELDDPDNPQAMDAVVRMTGASTVDWAFKTECCGAGRNVDLPKQARPLLYRILRNARANGANCIVTACPMCMMNLDMRQDAVNMEFAEDFHIPVFFLTELLATAMGATPKQSGVHTHFTPAEDFVRRALKASRQPQEVK